MSLTVTFSALRKFKLPLQLVDAGNYQQWLLATQTECLSVFNKTNSTSGLVWTRVHLSSITPAYTLDPKRCKVTFPDEWKEAAKGDSDPMDNPDFVQTCFDHALACGDGFKPWLPIVFAGVRASLSDHIAEQTSKVATGDLVALLLAIFRVIYDFHDDSNSGGDLFLL
jgi:hypothetical protein